MTCRSSRRASYIIATQRFKPRTIPVIAANPWYLERHAGGDRSRPLTVSQLLTAAAGSAEQLRGLVANLIKDKK